ncbi:unnamed protein product [Pedinophyceae sp. YPF-701]|nr:unnamed protein product [Pedinophyceae sp. YPF-701]
MTDRAGPSSGVTVLTVHADSDPPARARRRSRAKSYASSKPSEYLEIEDSFHSFDPGEAFRKSLGRQDYAEDSGDDDDDDAEDDAAAAAAATDELYALMGGRVIQEGRRHSSDRSVSSASRSASRDGDSAAADAVDTGDAAAATEELWAMLGDRAIVEGDHEPPQRPHGAEDRSSGVAKLPSIRRRGLLDGLMETPSIRRRLDPATPLERATTMEFGEALRDRGDLSRVGSREEVPFVEDPARSSASLAAAADAAVKAASSRRRFDAFGAAPPPLQAEAGSGELGGGALGSDSVEELAVSGTGSGRAGFEESVEAASSPRQPGERGGGGFSSESVSDLSDAFDVLERSRGERRADWQPPKPLPQLGATSGLSSHDAGEYSTDTDHEDAGATARRRSRAAQGVQAPATAHAGAQACGVAPRRRDFAAQVGGGLNQQGVQCDFDERHGLLWDSSALPGRVLRPATAQPQPPPPPASRPAAPPTLPWAFPGAAPWQGAPAFLIPVAFAPPASQPGASEDQRARGDAPASGAQHPQAWMPFPMAPTFPTGSALPWAHWTAPSTAAGASTVRNDEDLRSAAALAQNEQDNAQGASPAAQGGEQEAGVAAPSVAGPAAPRPRCMYRSATAGDSKLKGALEAVRRRLQTLCDEGTSWARAGSAGNSVGPAPAPGRVGADAGHKYTTLESTIAYIRSTLPHPTV